MTDTLGSNSTESAAGHLSVTNLGSPWERIEEIDAHRNLWKDDASSQGSQPSDEFEEKFSCFQKKVTCDHFESAPVQSPAAPLARIISASRIPRLPAAPSPGNVPRTARPPLPPAAASFTKPKQRWFLCDEVLPPPKAEAEDLEDLKAGTPACEASKVQTRHYGVPIVVDFDDATSPCDCNTTKGGKDCCTDMDACTKYGGGDRAADCSVGHDSARRICDYIAGCDADVVNVHVGRDGFRNRKPEKIDGLSTVDGSNGHTEDVEDYGGDDVGNGITDDASPICSSGDIGSEYQQNMWTRNPLLEEVCYRCARPRSEHQEAGKNKMRTDAYGEIFISGSPAPAQYIRVADDTNIERLFSFCETVWGIPNDHSIILSVVGREDIEVNPLLQYEATKGLMKMAKETNALLITSGLDLGAMKMMGDARKQAHVRLPLIGIPTWGTVENNVKLCSRKRKPRFSLVTYEPIEATSASPSPYLSPQPPRSVQSSPVRGGSPALDSERGPRITAPLNPFHTHFIMVDDGSFGTFDREVSLRAQFEKKLRSRLVGGMADSPTFKESRGAFPPLQKDGSSSLPSNATEARHCFPASYASGTPTPETESIKPPLLSFSVENSKCTPTLSCLPVLGVTILIGGDRKSLVLVSEAAVEGVPVVTLPESGGAAMLLYHTWQHLFEYFCASCMAAAACTNCRRTSYRANTECASHVCVSMAELQRQAFPTQSGRDSAEMRRLLLRCAGNEHGVSRYMYNSRNVELRRCLYRAILHDTRLSDGVACCRPLSLSQKFAYCIRWNVEEIAREEILTNLVTFEQDRDELQKCWGLALSKGSQPFMAILLEKDPKIMSDEGIYQYVSEFEANSVHKSFLIDYSATVFRYRRKQDPDDAICSLLKDLHHLFEFQGDLSDISDASVSIMDDPAFSLMMWVAILGDVELTRFFWRRTKDPLASIVLCDCVFRRMTAQVREGSEVSIKRFTSAVENLASGYLVHCYEENKQRTMQRLEIPTTFNDSIPLFDMIFEGNCEGLIETKCVRHVLDGRWNHPLRAEVSSLKLFLGTVFFLILPPYVVKSEETTTTHTPSPPTEDSVKTSHRLLATLGAYATFLTIPAVKFYAHILADIALFFLFGVVVVSVPPTSPLRSEQVLFLWMTSIFPFDTITEIWERGELRSMYEWSDYIGRRLEGRQCRWYGSLWGVHACFLKRLYVGGKRWLDMWNSMNALLFTLFFSGVLLRLHDLHDPEYDPYAGTPRAKIFLIFCLLISALRVLRLFTVNAHVGPLLVSFKQLRTDLIAYSIVLLVFLIAFGFGLRGLASPATLDDSSFFDQFRPIIETPYFMSHGIFTSHSFEGDTYKALISIYLFVVNVILMNVLIAMMGSTYSRMSDSLQGTWLNNYYETIKISEQLPVVPHPLSGAIRGIRAGVWIIGSFLNMFAGCEHVRSACAVVGTYAGASCAVIAHGFTNVHMMLNQLWSIHILPFLSVVWACTVTCARCVSSYAVCVFFACASVYKRKKRRVMKDIVQSPEFSLQSKSPCLGGASKSPLARRLQSRASMRSLTHSPNFMKAESWFQTQMNDFFEEKEKSIPVSQKQRQYTQLDAPPVATAPMAGTEPLAAKEPVSLLRNEIHALYHDQLLTALSEIERGVKELRHDVQDIHVRLAHIESSPLEHSKSFPMAPSPGQSRTIIDHMTSDRSVVSDGVYESRWGDSNEDVNNIASHGESKNNKDQTTSNSLNVRGRSVLGGRRTNKSGTLNSSSRCKESTSLTRARSRSL
eukprot:Rmarinus@m.2925